MNFQKNNQKNEAMERILLLASKATGVVIMAIGIIGAILFLILTIVSLIDHWNTAWNIVFNPEGVRMMGAMAIFMAVGLTGFIFKKKSIKTLKTSF